jgi:hypothetical protein
MRTLVVATALTLSTASMAGALPLTLYDNGGAPERRYVTPSYNDVIPGYEGYTGDNLYLTAEAGTVWQVTFSFVGSESGWDNVLHTPGGALSEAPGSVSFLMTAAGTNSRVLIPFSFSINGVANRLVNGQNGNELSTRSYFVSFDDRNRNNSSPRTGYSALIAFDDGGAGPDDNHDDHVSRITVARASVPEPTTLLLSALGLFGTAAAFRRRGAQA